MKKEMNEWMKNHTNKTKRNETKNEFYEFCAFAFFFQMYNVWIADNNNNNNSINVLYNDSRQNFFFSLKRIQKKNYCWEKVKNQSLLLFKIQVVTLGLVWFLSLSLHSLLVLAPTHIIIHITMLNCLTSCQK